MTTATTIRPTSVGLFSYPGWASPANVFNNAAGHATLLKLDSGGFMNLVWANTLTVRPETEIVNITFYVNWSHQVLPNPPVPNNTMDFRVNVTGVTGQIIRNLTGPGSIDGNPQPTPGTTQSFTVSERPDGRPWLISDIPKITTGLTINQNHDSYVYEVWAVVQTNDAPKVQGNLVGAVISLQPTFTFNVTDFDTADTISKYRMRVFTIEKALTAGSDWDALIASGADYDSGEVSGSFAPSATFAVPTGVDLVNGKSYRAYLDVWDQNGVSNYTTQNVVGSFYSAAAVDVSSLAIPRLKLDVTDDGNKWIRFIVEGQDNLMGYGGSTFENGGGDTEVAATSNTSVAVETVSYSVADAGHVLKMTATAGGDINVYFGNYKVDPTNQPWMSASAIVNTAVTRRNCRLVLNFHDAANTLVGQVVGPFVGERPAGNWATAAVSKAAVPGTATYCRLQFQIQGCAASEVHYADKIGVFTRKHVNEAILPRMAKQFALTGVAIGWELASAPSGEVTSIVPTIEQAPDGLLSEAIAQKLKWTTNTASKGMRYFHSPTVGQEYTYAIWVHANQTMDWVIGATGIAATGVFNVPANTWTLLKLTGTVTAIAGDGTNTVEVVAGGGVPDVEAFLTTLQAVNVTGVAPGTYDPADPNIADINGWTRGRGLTTQKLLLQRRVKETAEWQDMKSIVDGYPELPDLEDVNLDYTAQTATVFDFFADPHFDWEYRLRSTGLHTDGASISSPWGFITTPDQLTPVDKALLKSTSDPASYSLRLAFEYFRREMTVAKKRVTHWPLGRSKPVVISGQRNARSWEFGVYCKDRETAELLEELFDRGEAMVLQLQRDQVVVNINGDYQRVDWQTHEDEVMIRGTFQEVDGGEL